nr:zinc finger, CCHC-type [Tanacetum cinerariifolium]
MGRGNTLAYAPKPKIPPPPKREDPAKDSICHECGETRNWKRNCPQYLTELLKKKNNAASGTGGSEPEIQQNLEKLHAHEMLQELKTLFAQQAEHELLQTTRDFHSCKQEEGQ